MRHGQVPEILHDGQFYGASCHLAIRENTQTTAVTLARLSLKLLYAYWRNHFSQSIPPIDSTKLNHKTELMMMAL